MRRNWSRGHRSELTHTQQCFKQTNTLREKAPLLLECSLHFSQYLQPLQPQFCSASLDVLGLPLRSLPDAVLGSGLGLRAAPDAPPGRDEVGVAARVREGVGGASGTLAPLEGGRLFPPLLLLQLHLVLLPVSLHLGDDGKWTRRS